MVAPILEGVRRKDAAFTLLEARRTALLRRAQRALLGIVLGRDVATIDDVRDVVPLPDGIDPVAFGPFANELAYAGIIEAAGFVKSRRPEAHARPITVWRLRDAVAARDWLATHPELPDPQTSEAATVLPDAASIQRSLFS